MGMNLQDMTTVRGIGVTAGTVSTELLLVIFPLDFKKADVIIDNVCYSAFCHVAERFH